MPFDEFYQRYIFDVQDQNIEAEVHSLNTTDILTIDRLIDKLHRELLGI